MIILNSQYEPGVTIFEKEVFRRILLMLGKLGEDQVLITEQDYDKYVRYYSMPEEFAKRQMDAFFHQIDRPSYFFPQRDITAVEEVLSKSISFRPSVAQMRRNFERTEANTYRDYDLEAAVRNELFQSFCAILLLTEDELETLGRNLIEIPKDKSSGYAFWLFKDFRDVGCISGKPIKIVDSSRIRFECVEGSMIKRPFVKDILITDVVRFNLPYFVSRIRDVVGLKAKTQIEGPITIDHVIACI